MNDINDHEYKGVTAMTCATIRGRKTIIIGSQETVQFLYPESWESDSIDLRSQFNRTGRQAVEVGQVDKLEVRNDNVAILTVNNKHVSAFGVSMSKHPNEVYHPWPVENTPRYGSIALCPNGDNFITGRKHGQIYVADCYSLSHDYNHVETVFEKQEDVHAISFYPTSSQTASKSCYNIFSVAGDADTIRFFAKDDIKNTFHWLSDYTIPVRWTSTTAYNVSIEKIVENSQHANINSFNAFRDAPRTNPSVIHTVFSPNGKYFAYATTDGFVGILKFKLLDPEKALITKDQKKREQDEYWEKLRSGTNIRLLGAWVD
ncbi:hypothetical protein B0O99DRAFT_263209 [Bisporella sp. PMI_857]|nr:hypothetical protein B0O99DRAFT_263209 [Bisporella sp. PMI_857]